MGWLIDLDAAVRQRLEAVLIDGRAAFRTVGPMRGMARSPLHDEMLAADKPAAYHFIQCAADGRHGPLARLRVLLVAQGLQAPHAAWYGDSRSPGIYAIAEAVAAALVQPDLAGTAGAWLREHQLAHADRRVVAFAQEYEVLAAGESLLLDGRDLLNPRCLLHLVRCEQAAHWQSEPLAGSEQRYARWQGRSAPAIVFEGTLWAADACQLHTLEQAFDDLLADRTLHTLQTADHIWPDVALVAWHRTGPRASPPLLGLVGRSVRIVFEQHRQ